MDSGGGPIPATLRVALKALRRLKRYAAADVPPVLQQLAHVDMYPPSPNLELLVGLLARSAALPAAIRAAAARMRTSWRHTHAMRQNATGVGAPGIFVLVRALAHRHAKLRPQMGAIEHACAEAHTRGTAAYRDQLQALAGAIRASGPAGLVGDIARGASCVAPARLAVMDVIDLDASRALAAPRVALNAFIKDAALPPPFNISSDEFQCPRCREHKTIFHKMQTRSADEAMTNIITCTNCGNRWSES
jgi:hypothetical protein